MNDKEMLVKVIFNQDTKKFEVQFGSQYTELNNVQFARMMEYLNLVWESFVNSQKKKGNL